MRKLILAAIILIALFAAGCNRSDDDGNTIAVFVPGQLEGSPTYEMMDAGVRAATAGSDIQVKTIEGGFDQATWLQQLTTLASEGLYGLIVTSNPAMPELCARVAESFPDQAFLVLDGVDVDAPSVTTLEFDHREQAFLIGYFAALVTSGDLLSGANADLEVGLVIGQEYPQMTREIQPGFEIGLHTAQPEARIHTKVLGNWYDAEKARELASGMIADGVDVILTIAGGANQGVVSAAQESGTYVLWFDSDGVAQAPGTILASAVIDQERAAEELIRSWMEGRLEIGSHWRVGVSEGYVAFPMESREFTKHVPETYRDEMRRLIGMMEDGSLSLRGAGD